MSSYDCYNKDFKSEQELYQLDELTNRFNNIIFLASVRHGRAYELVIDMNNFISPQITQNFFSKKSKNNDENDIVYLGKQF